MSTDGKLSIQDSFALRFSFLCLTALYMEIHLCIIHANMRRQDKRIASED